MLLNLIVEFFTQRGFESYELISNEVVRLIRTIEPSIGYSSWPIIASIAHCLVDVRILFSIILIDSLCANETKEYLGFFSV